MSRTKKWFIKVRGSYLPTSWQGWLTYVPYLAYIIGVLVFVIKRKDSVWLALFTVLPNWVAAAVILTWLARHKS
jgi:hypothetical protein